MEEKVFTNSKLKSIVVIILIISMLASFATPFKISKAADDQNQYVKFKSNWTNNTNTLDTLSNRTVYALFDMQLTGSVATGFRNMRIKAEDITENPQGLEYPNALIRINPAANTKNIINGTKSSTLEFNTPLNSGTSISGDIAISVSTKDYNNFDLFVKTIKVTLSGEYIDPVTKELIYVDEIIEPTILTLNVTPEQKVTYFGSNILLNEPGKGCIIEPNRNPIIEGGRNVGWYIDSVYLGYTLQLNSVEYTQEGELQIKINRKTKNSEDIYENKLDVGYSVNWGDLETDFGAPIKTDNQDGTDTYTFKKGSASETFVRENTFSIKDKLYNITINYLTENTIDDFDAEPNTEIYFESKYISNGWKITENSVGTQTEKILNEINRNVYHYPGLFLYTPGQHSWIGTLYNSGSSITKEGMDGFIEDGEIDLSFYLGTDYVWGPESGEYDGIISAGVPELEYYSDDKTIEKLVLSNNEMVIKKIIASEIAGGKKLEIFNGLNSIGEVGSFETLIVPQGSNLIGYSVKLKNFIDGNFWYDTIYDGYSVVYTLSKQKLLDAGLTETEIRNIITIKQKAEIKSGQWIYGGGTAQVRAFDSDANRKSYLELNLGEFDCETTTENKTIQLSMYKNSNIMTNNNVSVRNVNPKIYVKLSKGFRYQIKNISMTQNPNIFIKNSKLEKINNEQFIVIECEGTYDSTKSGRIDINIDIARKLEDLGLSRVQNIVAYMLTDNENYFTISSNMLNLQKGTNTPSTLYSIQRPYNIVRTDSIETASGIYNMLGKRLLAGSNGNYLNIDSAVKLETNSIVKYVSVINNYSEKISNISIINRLPISGNKAITNTNIDLGSEISLTNLNNIKVYRQLNGILTEVAQSNYTIGYSNNPVATTSTTFDTTYSGYTNGIADVTTIQIKMNPEYTLQNNSYLYVEYEMTMPDAEGKTAQATAIRYIKDGETEATVLEPAPAYVQNGSPNGTIRVIKKFENLPAGTAPSGINLNGIEFKLINVETGETLVTSGTTAQGIVGTNISGHAEFTDVPPGQYRLVEVSTIPGYKGIDEYLTAEIVNGEYAEILAENKLERSKLTLQKTWNDTDEQKGAVTFRIKSKDTGSTYDVFQTTDEETGLLVVNGIPYGTYEISEYEGVYGWYAPAQEIVIDEPDESVTVENQLGKGTLTILKTVPEGDTVQGLTFDISGTGYVQYTNKLGNTVKTDYNKTIVIGDDYSSDLNVNVEIAPDNLSATITLSDLYLGDYTIEEMEIPKIQGTEIERYVAVRRSVSITENGQNREVTLVNRWKRGILEIKKTAYLQDGENRLEIGDLSSFKVRVEGTSHYGNSIDRILSFDQDGNITTTLEIGEYTITEVSADGYDVYYNVNGQLVNSLIGTEVEIKYNEVTKSAETTTQEITNVHTGVGYVRVVKTLEGIADAQKVIDAGIRFRVVGKNVAGGNVSEEITIDQIDTQNNVAYGISAPISTGGEYQLEEIEETVPDYFESVEPIAVNLTTANTVDSPLVIDIENKRTKGNLEVITETNPKGGTLTGITYRVTEVEINDDGTYTKFDGGLDRQGNLTEDTRIEVAGDNGVLNPSFAELKDIKSGNYLVEQLTVPDGYDKDVSQVVEVPSYGTGYAVFEINQRPENLNTKLIINKEIINSTGTTATAQDFEQAKLNENESFEVKVTNVNTRKVYYTFISSAQKGTIIGLEPGTYEIEETYKPKYETEGYYRKVGGVALNRITANTEGKYIVEILDNGPENPASELELTLRNQINTEFKFGGQDLIDNYSKVDVEQQKLEVITKAVVYVVDENGDEIPNARFKLLDSQGQTVVLGSVGTEFTTSNKKIIINGLPAGTYTLVNTSVPEGYSLAANKQLIVYNDVVRIVRIEIQRNIPRGQVTLSTVYVDKNNETKYVPRSKYKVVDKATGELVKFTKTLTGDYTTSNLPDATPEVILKSGIVELKNLPVGTYEVGLVDVTAGFGMQKDVPETVEIAQNAVENISLEMTKKSIVKISMGYENTIILNESGELWIIGANTGMAYGSETDSILMLSVDFEAEPNKINLPNNIKIIDFAQGPNHVVALDSNGKVWTWGYMAEQLGIGRTEYSTTKSPICISELEGNPIKVAYDNGIKIREVEAGQGSSYALDSNGKMWSWGVDLGDGTSNKSNIPVCISDIDNHPFKKLYEDGIELVQISTSTSSSIKVGVLDENGRAWVFGSTYIGDGSTSSSSLPICISDKSNDFNGVKIESISVGYSSVAIDREGNAWTWGYNSNGVLGIGNMEDSAVPVKISKEFFGGYKIKKVKFGTYGSCYFIDEIGRLWGTGANYALAGMGENINSTPICLSETSIISGKNIVDIAVSYDYLGIVVLDSNGKLYGFGGNQERGDLGARKYYNYFGIEPIDFGYTKNLEYNLKFVEVYSPRSPNIFAIDEKRRLWSAGYGEEIGQGEDSDYNTLKLVPRLENEKIIDASFDSNAYSSMLVTESGKVFFSGAYEGNISAILNTTRSHVFIDITDRFELEDGIKIVDIEQYTNSSVDRFIALDSLGRLWINTTCISKNSSSPLYNIKLINAAVDEYAIHAIDSDGKIWYIKNNTEPVCLSDEVYNNLSMAYQNGTRFVEIQMTNYGNNTIALDKEGKLWMLEGYISGLSIKGNNAICLTDSNFMEYKDKIIKKFKVVASSSLVIQEINGNLSYISNDTDTYTYPRYLVDFDFKNGRNWIDQFGQIWRNNERVYSEKSNPLYDKKVSKIITDGYVELDTDKGEIYAVNRSGISKTMLYSEKYLTNYLNTNLIQVISQLEKTNYTSYSDIYNLPSATVPKSFYAAVDDNGKIWTWGSDNYGILGDGADSTFKSIPVCISDITGTELNNAYINSPEFKIVKMAKVLSNFNFYVDYSFFALDNTGKIWNWGYNIYDKGYFSPVCISDINYCSIYGKTIVELNETNNTVKDSLGNVYGYANLKFRADQRNHTFIIETPSQGSTEVFEPTGALVGKTIVQNTDNMAIDSEGNLYGRRLFDGYYRKYNNEFVNITNQKLYRDSVVPNNNVLMNNPKNNILYETKFSEIYNDKILKDINNKYWFFPETGDPINISEKVVIEESPLYGKTIKDTIISGKYVIASDNKIYRIGLRKPVYIMDNLPENIEFKDIQYKFDNDNMLYYIGLDINGKVWACGNGNFGQIGNGNITNITTPICISDIAGTELANEYINNSSFKIENLYVKSNVYKNSYSIICLDSNGKVWSWGYNFDGQLGNGTTMYSSTPICITNIANTDFNNAYVNNNSKIESISLYENTNTSYSNSVSIAALDSNGKIWTWGSNINGNLATGDKENKNSPICVSDLSTEIVNNGETFKITKIDITSNVLVALGNDGKVYTAGSVWTSGNILGKTAEELTLMSVNGVTGIQDYKINETTGTFINYMIAFGENTVWAWGKGTFISEIPQNISTTIPSINKLESSGTTSFILDSQGKLYVIGYANNKMLGYTSTTPVSTPVDITANLTLPIYQKNITDIIMNNYVITYSTSTGKVIGNYILAVDSDGVIYEWGNGITSMQVCTKFDSITQSIFGNTSITNKLQIANQLLKNNCSDMGSNNARTTINANNKKWNVIYNRNTYEIISVEELNLAPVYQNLLQRKDITAVLDSTHIELSDGKVYAISETGVLTEVTDYEPSNEVPEYPNIEIAGVNIVDNTNYKALDDQGNLYVWGPYSGGYPNIGADVANAINTTAREYIVEPIYSVTNGWTVIKSNY